MVVRGLIGGVMVGLGLVFVAVSVQANYLAGAGLGETAEKGLAFAWLGAAMSVANAGLPFAVTWGWRRGDIGVAGVAAALLALFLSYSLWSAIGYAAGNRGAVLSGRDGLVAAYQSALRQEADLRRQLDVVAGARTEVVVTADIAKMKRNRLWESSKGCTDASALSSRAFCTSYEKLTGELAAWGESARLRRRLTEVEQQIAALRAQGADRDTDPQASLVSRWFGVSRADVQAGWPVAFAILVEVGCAFLPFIGLSMLGIQHAPIDDKIGGERPLPDRVTAPSIERVPAAPSEPKQRILPPLYEAEFDGDGDLKLRSGRDTACEVTAV